MEIKIEFDGTGDGITDNGVHFVGCISDYTLCGITMDLDTDTAGGFNDTTKKVDCEQCIRIINYCKSISKNQYITIPPIRGLNMK